MNGSTAPFHSSYLQFVTKQFKYCNRFETNKLWSELIAAFCGELWKCKRASIKFELTGSKSALTQSTSFLKLVPHSQIQFVNHRATSMDTIDWPTTFINASGMNIKSLKQWVLKLASQRFSSHFKGDTKIGYLFKAELDPQWKR